MKDEHADEHTVDQRVQVLSTWIDPDVQALTSEDLSFHPCEPQCTCVSPTLMVKM